MAFSYCLNANNALTGRPLTRPCEIPQRFLVSIVFLAAALNAATERSCDLPVKNHERVQSKVEAMKHGAIALALGAAVLVGCAGGVARRSGDEDAQRYVDNAGAPIDRITSFRLDGWTPVSRNRLVVWTRTNEAYLVTVWNSCDDLKFANRIGITSTGNTVTRFERVTVGGNSCPISEIRPIDIRQMHEDRQKL